MTTLPYVPYLLATVLNLGSAPLLGGLIRWLWACNLAEALKGHAEASDRTKLPEKERNAVEESIGRGQPWFGSIIGLLERQIYIYVLMTKGDVFGGVLVFKAFTGWMDLTKVEGAPPTSAAYLSRFYGYAIGNFTSLLWAIGLHEVAKSVVCHGPGLARQLLQLLSHH